MISTGPGFARDVSDCSLLADNSSLLSTCQEPTNHQHMALPPIIFRIIRLSQPLYRPSTIIKPDHSMMAPRPAVLLMALVRTHRSSHLCPTW
jgi:hypothetical protein